MNADREEQEDELLALQSIFDAEEFFRDEPKFAGEIRVSVELPADFTVVLKEGETLRQYEISFLPPLNLTFELPEDYPSSSPPSFTLTCSWLTHIQLSALNAHLTDLYKATWGAVVLFTWIQFLKEDALRFLDMHPLLELPSDVVSDLSATSSGAEHTTEILVNSDQSKGSSEDSQEEEESGQNNLITYHSKGSQNGLNPDQKVDILIPRTAADAKKISDVSDEEETDQKLETSEFKAVSEHNQEDFLNGGDSSVSSLLSSSYPHPPDPSGQNGSASLPIHPKKSPRNEHQTPSGLSLTPSQALMSQILIYNADQKQKAFTTTVFDCGVCFMGWLGSECIQMFECGHIFCRGCLAKFCKLQITEGNVQNVTCPDADCPATPTPAQVKSLVGEELFSRYDRLLLQTTLDHMPDVVYCPRRTCAAAVIVEKSSMAAMCSVCKFAFCVSCKKTYHGTDCKDKKKKEEEKEKGQNALFAPLPDSQEGLEALGEDYSSGSKQRKKLLESRYGRGRLVFLVEYGLSEQWIEVNCKYCPHCYSSIQKQGGCNMMMCFRCNQRFCWSCLSRVPSKDAGRHYQESPDCMNYIS
ncbi:E3 ubiquitin-protein ligase RNF14-like [Notolabrus celidotus]|uniref:E3 ubiquitin-protein ligase RNF14-like n=1 Tax=Notolabrus celidotus TaxID=1203425 RepID=UPI0014904B82|nr:E3 ubiquitin-protein ligase RNF14-like [Notolabrus celidotus]